ncbi:MAG: hypothetical protein Q8L46_02475 [candidate division WWE3 bacterium]|nr:hypothetical protein [candidate division WWE3 bacterium]
MKAKIVGLSLVAIVLVVAIGAGVQTAQQSHLVVGLAVGGLALLFGVLTFTVR